MDEGTIGTLLFLAVGLALVIVVASIVLRPKARADIRRSSPLLSGSPTQRVLALIVFLVGLALLFGVLRLRL